MSLHQIDIFVAPGHIFQVVCLSSSFLFFSFFFSFFFFCLQSMDPLSATFEQASTPPYYTVHARVANSVSRNSSTRSQATAPTTDGRPDGSLSPSQR